MTQIPLPARDPSHPSRLRDPHDELLRPADERFDARDISDREVAARDISARDISEREVAASTSLESDPRAYAEKRREGSPALGTSFLREGISDASWDRWRQIQGNFVDDPRNSVAEAHGLVSELIDDIVRRFEVEREQLEKRWSRGEDVSTEDLRHCLQRYRDFFGRLLANLSDGKA